MRAPRQRRRYILPAVAFFVLAVAGIVTGTVAAAHNMAGLSRLAADLVGVALALMLATLVTAYLNEVRIPALGWQLAEQALDDREISCPGRHCARAGSTAGRAISPALSVPASACPTGATPK